ncbi:hypothetical protein B0H12DRAFT_272928 [Mycena haematopus]|nr:hypothetical protein B0H12DRAFT_272928 [Mycena haematopus]
MTHRFRPDATLCAVGFILTLDQMAAIALAIATRAFPAEIALHGSPLKAFKCRIQENSCEALATVGRQRFFVAVHFYPWVTHPNAKHPVELAEVTRRYDNRRLIQATNIRTDRILKTKVRVRTVDYVPAKRKSMLDAQKHLGLRDREMKCRSTRISAG